MRHIQFRSAAVLMAGVMGVGAVQAQAIKAAPAEAPIPAIQDWSSRSVIYGKPLAPDEFEAQGRTAEMERRYRDPRYVAAVLRRFEAEVQRPSVGAQAKASATSSRGRGDHRDPRNPPAESSGEGLVHRDWSNVLGGGTSGLGGSGLPGVFPAKYTFDITAVPSCTNDFVVYPTNAAGAQSSGTFESRGSAFDDRPSNNGTITIGVAGTPRSVTLTAVDTPTTNLQFARGDNQNNNAAEAVVAALNLAAAVNLWSAQTGITAIHTVGTSSVTFVRTTGGNSATIPVTQNLGNNNFSLGATAAGTGAPGQPTIIAFNQLYQGTGACNGTWNANGAVKAPNVMWSYNTGDGYITETSPVLSYYDDGKQVAFIQRNANSLQLVLLKWELAQGSAGAPIAPADLSAAAYQAARSGTSTAVHKITLNGTSNTGSVITYSAPYVDYANDTLWVGDGNGRLHKFTGVFQGTPAEVTTGGFPAQVIAGANNGIKLSPPVEVEGQVYVGSQSGGAGIGGKLHRVNASTGAVADSVKLANDNTTGIRAPIIATFAPTASGGSLFAFLFNDGTVGDGSTCDIAANNNDACRVVARFTPGFAAGANPAQRAYVGRGNNAFSTLYQGAFDDAYFNSVNGTGNLYIVGGDIVDTFIPTLWKIPITNGVMGAPLIGTTMGPKTCSTTANCITNTDAIWDWSAVSSIKNGLNEYFYFSMRSSANKGGCVGACLFMFNLADLNGPGVGTGATWGTGNEPSASLLSPGGTGGITVDNTSSSTGSSQIYFSQLQSGGNAIQASQSGLQ